MGSTLDWVNRYNIPQAAIDELTIQPLMPDAPYKSEAAAQQQIRLEASKQGIRLFRNNNGACKDDTGRLIRYGLANDSAQVNSQVKSSDLIGVTPIVIGPEHAGMTMGIFTSIEVKRPGWKYRGTDREEAQLRWLILVNGMGGIGKFMTGWEDQCG